MQVMQLGKYGNFAFSGLRDGVRQFVKIGKDKSGTAILARISQVTEPFDAVCV